MGMVGTPSTLQETVELGPQPLPLDEAETSLLLLVMQEPTVVVAAMSAGTSACSAVPGLPVTRLRWARHLAPSCSQRSEAELVELLRRAEHRGPSPLPLEMVVTRERLELAEPRVSSLRSLGLAEPVRSRAEPVELSPSHLASVELERPVLELVGPVVPRT